MISLGSTGRNFAAGMSGGIAYVLDTHQTLRKHANHELVLFEDLSANDLAFVRGLVHRHYERTVSGLAWRVLSGWKKESRRFVKVIPAEYKRALKKQGQNAKTA